MNAETLSPTPLPALDAFLSLARARRSVRHFKPDALPEGILDRLLEAARWAPSGYNLQPTHFFVVTDTIQKKKLAVAAMNQKQVAEAPAVVVFAGDTRVAEHNFETVIQLERSIGAINEHYESLLRKFVPLSFNSGPLGLGWLWKAMLLPIVRLFAPVPALPVVQMDVWLGKQASLAGMNFMLAATAAGLSTIPMEGFDECRVRKALGIADHFRTVLIIPVGYPVQTPSDKTRLPFETLVHRL